MSLDLAASDTEDGVVYLDDLKAPQEGAEGELRAVLGDATEHLLTCAGGCGRRLLTHSRWSALPKEKRAHLKTLNVYRKEARGCCWKCAPAAPPPDIQSWKGAIPIHKRVDFPALWKKVRAAGGSYRELAEELGITREHARQCVKKMQLPEVDQRRMDSEERDVFIEEMERLVSFGEGIHSIAQSFGLTADGLVYKVARLRERGLTKVRFDEYNDHTYTEVAAA